MFSKLSDTYNTDYYSKGIILAGGYGTRLKPITNVISKQLLPIYDKPMIYYPLSTLMLAGIREILIIVNEKDKELFIELLGDGSNFGISIEYAIQSIPNGLAEAFIIGEKFINGSNVALILGDNLFHGNDFIRQLRSQSNSQKFATVFAYPVSNPNDYAVIEFDENDSAVSIIEKPRNPKSKYAITGLYFYDNTVIDRAKNVVPSLRGELEITDINLSYLKDRKLKVEKMGRGMAWLDTGTHDFFNEASQYIRTLEKRQGFKIGCPEEIAFNCGYITREDLIKLAKPLNKSDYGNYLLNLIEN